MVLVKSSIHKRKEKISENPPPFAHAPSKIFASFVSRKKFEENRFEGVPNY
jgi:hypothetical protein